MIVENNDYGTIRFPNCKPLLPSPYVGDIERVIARHATSDTAPRSIPLRYPPGEVGRISMVGGRESERRKQKTKTRKTTNTQLWAWPPRSPKGIMECARGHGGTQHLVSISRRAVHTGMEFHRSFSTRAKSLRAVGDPVSVPSVIRIHLSFLSMRNGVLQHDGDAQQPLASLPPPNQAKMCLSCLEISKKNPSEITPHTTFPLFPRRPTQGTRASNRSKASCFVEAISRVPSPSQNKSYSLNEAIHKKGLLF